LIFFGQIVSVFPALFVRRALSIVLMLIRS
jgi:hypothetical protein